MVWKRELNMWRRKRRQIFGEGKGGKYWENENIWLEKEEKAGEGKRGERKNGGTKFPLWKESGKN